MKHTKKILCLFLAILYITSCSGCSLIEEATTPETTTPPKADNNEDDPSALPESTVVGAYHAERVLTFPSLEMFCNFMSRTYHELTNFYFQYINGLTLSLTDRDALEINGLIYHSKIPIGNEKVKLQRCTFDLNNNTFCMIYTRVDVPSPPSSYWFIYHYGKTAYQIPQDAKIQTTSQVGEYSVEGYYNNDEGYYQGFTVLENCVLEIRLYRYNNRPDRLGVIDYLFEFKNVEVCSSDYLTNQ